MGDRTRLEISLREEDYKTILKKEFNGEEHKFLETYGLSESDLQDWGEINLRSLVDYEANHGNCVPLEEYLIKNKIEFDKEWESGGNYEKGNAHYRLIKDKIQGVEYWAGDEKIIDFLKELQKIKEPKKLKETINQKLKKLIPFKILDLSENNSVRFIIE